MRKLIICFYVLYVLMITYLLLTPTYFSLTLIEHKVSESIGGHGSHFIAYFILFIIAKKVHTKFNYLTCAIICCSCSFLIEGIQYFIPDRDFEGLDMIASSLGIFLGVIIYKLFIEKCFEIKQIAT